ncbi:MAG TPA: hypothetical protein VEJ19_03580 [Nitrososphaerales archaeon]|nr:hypothetical protein [Nitrososphaerales archaeon]
MTVRMKDVRAYIDELEKTKEDRPEQVKEGLEIYISLWEKVIERGVVEETDGVDAALAKIEKEGGLYAAAGEPREPS